MSEYRMRGKLVTEEQIRAWADEAEAGYDLSTLPEPRRGRPTTGEGPGTVVSVRLDDRTLSALMRKAEAAGISQRSEALRAAVREWVGRHVA
ncbi:ribbon-helix-helix domain-containing protein [Corynebacterium mastitidis]